MFQLDDNPTEVEVHPQPHGGFSFFFDPYYALSHPLFFLTEPLALLGGALWLWMLIHCIRNDPDRGIWLWIILIGNVPGAIVYFFVRWWPQREIAAPGWFRRFTSGGKLAKLQAVARTIGNAQQHIEVGDLLRELGRNGEALAAYQKALDRDAGSLPAHWGAAQAALATNDLPVAREHLDFVLQRDAAYKFGDVSLALSRLLLKQGDKAAARAHLEQHLARWPHPEAHVHLAELLAESSEHDLARLNVERVLADLAIAPAYYVRQNRSWGRKARALQKRLQ